MPLTAVLVQSEDELIMFQCSISRGMDCRHPYTADVRAFAQTLPNVWLSERDGAFCKALFTGNSTPSVWHDSGAVPEEGQGRWDSQIPSCGRNGKTCGTVVFLHVRTRSALWLPHFLQK